MRFSTRNTHKRGKAIALAASAAVLGIGGLVGYTTEKGASAETAFNNDNFYFALKSDYDGINSAQTKAGTYFGSGSNPVYCQEKDFINPRTNTSASYYVFANNPTGEGAHDYCTEIPTNPTILNDNGASILSKTYNDTYMAQNYAQPLGVLGAFHLMGFDQLDLGNQTNGNIITKNLNSAGSYIGYFEEPTISYARQIGTSIGTTFSFANAHNNGTNVLVTGYQADIGTGDNGTKWTINGNKSNMPDRIINGEYADNLWQEADANQQFIDIEALRSNAESWNTSLSNLNDTLTSSDYDFTDENNLKITIPSATKGQLNVLTLGKEQLSREYLQGHHDICVYGFDQHTPGTLLINVDLAGETDFEMNNSFKLCYKTADEVKYPDSIVAGATSTDQIDFTDGQRDCVREQWIHDKFENHVIVNFYDSENGNKRYTGDINIARETTTFAVAPDADIRITASSFQGIAIAKTYTSTGADTYYLSLHPQQPLGQVSECTIEINHYLAGTTTKIAASDTATTTCEHAEKTVQPTTTFTDSTKTYGFVSAEYIENGDEANKEDITDDLPKTVINSKTSQVYNLYYNETCTYVINHVNYYDTSTVYQTQNGTVVCNTPVEVGHLQSVVNNGHTPVYDDGSVVEVISTLPKNVDGRPTTFTVKYKDPCTIDVYHRLKGTQTNLAAPEHYPGFCHELQQTINLSASVLENYNFDNAIEVESDTVIQESQFPLNTGAITSNQTYIIEYEAKSTPPSTCALYIHHYKKGTTEKVDDDISMENICNNIQMQVEISEKALANGYVFSSAKMESERIVQEDISEDEFPLTTTNNFPVKVYTIYYEMPETPETPETKDNNPSFVLSTAGAVFGLGTAGIFLARRRS